MEDFVPASMELPLKSYLTFILTAMQTTPTFFFQRWVCQDWNCEERYCSRPMPTACHAPSLARPRNKCFSMGLNCVMSWSSIISLGFVVQAFNCFFTHIRAHVYKYKKTTRNTFAICSQTSDKHRCTHVELHSTRSLSSSSNELYPSIEQIHLLD